jgi:hypothetical protein
MLSLDKQKSVIQSICIQLQILWLLACDANLRMEPEDRLDTLERQLNLDMAGS